MLVLGIVTMIGLVLTAVSRIALGRVARPLPPPTRHPPISILKPLKGVDPGLERNLESVFAQDYRSFEVLCGAEDPDDPALEVARRVAARHPHVTCTIVAGASGALNPKVKVLAKLAPRARHERLLISDSNIGMHPRHLSDIAAQLEIGEPRLVWSFFRGAGSGPGAALEALQLNTFVMGGMGAVHALLRRPCGIGKSMLVHRSDINRRGGWDHFGRYLAEDQVLAEEVGRVAIVGRPVVNELGRRTVSAFVARHVRWCQIRRRIDPLAYLGEWILNPAFFALATFAAGRSTAAALFALGAIAGAAMLDRQMERLLGARRPFLHYLALEPLLSVIRVAVWPVAWFGSTTTWRGGRIRIGARTLIEPQEAPPGPETAQTVS